MLEQVSSLWHFSRGRKVCSCYVMWCVPIETLSHSTVCLSVCLHCWEGGHPAIKLALTNRVQKEVFEGIMALTASGGKKKGKKGKKKGKKVSSTKKTASFPPSLPLLSLSLWLNYHNIIFFFLCHRKNDSSCNTQCNSKTV